MGTRNPQDVGFSEPPDNGLVLPARAHPLHPDGRNGCRAFNALLGHPPRKGTQHLYDDPGRPRGYVTPHPDATFRGREDAPLHQGDDPFADSTGGGTEVTELGQRREVGHPRTKSPQFAATRRGIQVPPKVLDGFIHRHVGVARGRPRHDDAPYPQQPHSCF